MIDNMAGTSQKTEGNRTDWNSTPGNVGLSQSGTNAVTTGENAAVTDSGLGQTAHEYVDKISDAVIQAKDYVGDKVGTVSEKVKDFASNDLSGLAEKAKDYARENPAQAILVSAAAGMLLGMIVRGRR